MAGGPACIFKVPVNCVCNRGIPLAAKRNSNRIRLPRLSPMLNIGTLIFGVIFLYILISVFLYLTDEHVTAYEVMEGSISGNYRFTALAAKEEKIVTAPQSGSVTYYAREGAKANVDSVICSIDESAPGYVRDMEVEMTAEDSERMRSAMASYTINYRSADFQSVYGFKSDMESFVLELQTTEQPSAYILNQCTADESGFVVYSTDGLEGFTEDMLSPELFREAGYHKTGLRTGSGVTAGQNLYKLVTSETWAMYFPLSDALRAALQSRTSIRFRLLKDNLTFSAPFTVIENEKGSYGKITLTHSLARYVSDRYIEIEVLMDRKSGLKIPSTAIAEKTFYSIPQEYVITNSGTGSEITFLRESFRGDGSSNVQYVTATVYAKKDGRYLVDTGLLRDGDYIQMVNTTKKIQIREADTVTIQGVYNINKGYAVFREVTVIDENEEFCIVEADNIYSLAPHDRIVLDASQADTDEIVL